MFPWKLHPGVPADSYNNVDLAFENWKDPRRTSGILDQPDMLQIPDKHPTTDDFKTNLSPAITISSRASYNLVANKLIAKGYSEVDRFNGKKQKIVQWMHTKGLLRPDIYITVQESSSPDEDKVIGIAVGVNYPSRDVTKNFIENL